MRWGGIVKLVQVTVPHFKLSEITDAVRGAGASGVTVFESLRQMRQGPREARLPCMTLETVVHDDLVERVVESIVRAARTGPPTDGHIFVTAVASVRGIRTGAIDEAAIAP
jgi:nitrogen regulatory protein PII